MQRPPRSPNEPVLSKFVITRTLLVAVLMTAGAIALFHYEYTKDVASGAAPALALAQAQTLAVTTVILFQVFYVMNCRSLKGSVFSIGFFSNPWVFVGIGVIVLLQLGFIFLAPLNSVFTSSPIGLRELALAALVGSTIIPVISLEKWWRGRSQASSERRV